MGFMDDLRSRLAKRVQLTSDGHRAYLEAVEGAFGGDIDYAMLVKIYGNAPEAVKGRYSRQNAPARAKSGLKAIPTQSTFQLLMPSGRTLQCGCRCAGLPG